MTSVRSDSSGGGFEGDPVPEGLQSRNQMAGLPVPDWRSAYADHNTAGVRSRSAMPYGAGV